MAFGLLFHFLNKSLVVEPNHLKNTLVKLDHFPQVGVKIKNIWYHHLVTQVTFHSPKLFFILIMTRSPFFYKKTPPHPVNQRSWPLKVKSTIPGMLNFKQTPYNKTRGLTSRNFRSFTQTKTSNLDPLKASPGFSKDHSWNRDLWSALNIYIYMRILYIIVYLCFDLETKGKFDLWRLRGCSTFCAKYSIGILKCWGHDRFRCPCARGRLLQGLLTSLHPHISFTNTSNNLALQQGFSIHSRQVRLHPSQAATPTESHPAQMSALRYATFTNCASRGRRSRNAILVLRPLGL